MIIIFVAFPYCNGNLHIGHIFEFLKADIFCRFVKLFTKNKIKILSSMDVHGTPVMIHSNGYNIKKTILKNFENQRNSLKYFNINIIFKKTSSKENKKKCKEIFLYLIKKKKVILKKRLKPFDFENKIFIQERFYIGFCPKCKLISKNQDNCENCFFIFEVNKFKTKIKLIKKSNCKPIYIYSEDYYFVIKKKYFIELSKKMFEKKIYKKTIKNYPKRYLWCITRNFPYYGFKIFSKKFLNVWFDALINYITLFENFKGNKIKKILFFIGKDIVKFHSWFFLSLLKNTNNKINLVKKKIFKVHGFLNINNEKISKSFLNKKNNFLDYYKNMRFKPDYMRYYLAKIMKESTKDSNFIKEELIKKSNELIYKFINIFNRVKNIILKKKKIIDFKRSILIKKEFDIYRKVIFKFFKKFKYNKVINLSLKICKEINCDINKKKIWEKNNKKNNSKINNFCYIVLEKFFYICEYLEPIIPSIVKKIKKFIFFKKNKFYVLKNSLFFKKINEI